MADKIFEYIGDIIDQDVVQDWTNRLEAIQNAGGITNQTHNRSVGDIVKKSQTLDIYNDIIYTKNNISNLSGAVLNTYTDTSTGEVMDNDYLIGTIEKNIGILENFCIVFSPTCGSFCSSNCGGVSASNSANRGTFNTTCTTNNTGNFSSYFATYFVTHHSSNFAARNVDNKTGNTANRSSFFNSVRSPNDPFNYMHFHGSNTFFSAKKVHVHSSQNKTFHHTRHSTNFSSYHASKFTHNNHTFRTSHNGSNLKGNSANRSSVGPTYAANHGSTFSGNAATCSTDFIGKTVSFSVNNVSHIDSCMVVHSTYQVQGIDFTDISGE